MSGFCSDCFCSDLCPFFHAYAQAFVLFVFAHAIQAVVLVFVRVLQTFVFAHAIQAVVTVVTVLAIQAVVVVQEFAHVFAHAIQAVVTVVVVRAFVLDYGNFYFVVYVCYLPACFVVHFQSFVLRL